MTGMKAMRNYVLYANKPFTSLQIVNELGLCYETVKKYLQDFIAEGLIRQIGKDKGINVYVHPKYKDNASNYKATRQKHYTYESVQETYRRQLLKRKTEFDEFLEAL